MLPTSQATNLSGAPQKAQPFGLEQESRLGMRDHLHGTFLDLSSNQDHLPQ